MRGSRRRVKTPVGNKTKRGAELEGTPKTPRALDFSPARSSCVDGFQEQEEGKSLSGSRQPTKWSLVKQGFNIHANSNPEHPLLGKPKEQEIKVAELALSPICVNAIVPGVDQQVERKSSKRVAAHASKASRKKKSPPKVDGFAQDSNATSAKQVYANSPDAALRRRESAEEEDDESTEGSAPSSPECQPSPFSGNARRLVVWSNAAFYPGSVLDQRTCSRDSCSSTSSSRSSASSSRSLFQRSQPKSEASDFEKRLQSEDHEAEHYYTDMDLSRAVTSHARPTQGSSPDNRFREDNPKPDSHLTPVTSTDDKDDGARVSSTEFAILPDKLVSHPVIRKALFSSVDITDQSIDRAPSERVGLSSPPPAPEAASGRIPRSSSDGYSQHEGQATRPAAPEMQACQQRSSVFPNHSAMQAQEFGRDVDELIVPEKDDPDVSKKPVAIPDTSSAETRKDVQEIEKDTGIDKIKKEIQRLTQRLAELQLQQAAKRNSEQEKDIECDEKTTHVPSKNPQTPLSVVASPKPTTNTQIGEQRKVCKGSSCLQATLASKQQRRGAEGASPSPHLGERRKGWKGTASISCPQTPISEMSLKQQPKQAVEKSSPQVGEQGKLRKGRVVSAKFQQWQSKNSKQEQMAASKNPSLQSPQFQRRCVSLGAISCPVKGKALQYGFADSPAQQLKPVNGSCSKLFLGADGRKSIKKEEPRAAGGGGGKDECVADARKARVIRRLSLNPVSAMNAWASDLRSEHGRQLPEEMENKPKSLSRPSKAPLDHSASLKSARFVASRYGGPATPDNHQARDGKATACDNTISFKQRGRAAGGDEPRPASADATENAPSILSPFRKLTVRSGYPGRSGLTPVKGNMKKSDQSELKTTTNPAKEQQHPEGGLLQRKQLDGPIRDFSRNILPSRMAARIRVEGSKSTAALYECLESLVQDSKRFFKKYSQTKSDDEQKLCLESGNCGAQGVVQMEALASKPTLVKGLEAAAVQEAKEILPIDIHGPEAAQNTSLVFVTSTDGLEVERTMLPKINTSRLVSLSPRDSGCVKRVPDRQKKHMFFGMEKSDLQIHFEQAEGEAAEMVEVDVENEEAELEDCLDLLLPAEEDQERR